jgi:hypothetical protein
MALYRTKVLFLRSHRTVNGSVVQKVAFEVPETYPGFGRKDQTMRMKLAVAGLCVLGLLVTLSCSSTTHTQGAAATTGASSTPADNQLRQGMSSAEVRSAWGPPLEITQDPGAPGTEFWVYERGKTVPGGTTPIVVKTQYRLTMVNGELTKIVENPQ